jgi:FKBP-type peptidyl-prolyl cis-trans isomerase (trigger factor)
VEASFMVNAIRRNQLPEIDDEFAKDLEFDSVKDMKKKITEDMKEKNELKNRNIRINALITKLYIDNRFDLPEKTIQYLAEKELDQYKITDEQWRKYYEFQIRQQISMDFLNMYLMKALRKQYTLEPTEDDIEKYIEHEAKLSDQSIEDWKEKHKKTMEGEDFKETVGNYMILNKIADTCEFFVAEEEPIDTASADKEAKPKKKTTKQAKEKSE